MRALRATTLIFTFAISSAPFAAHGVETASRIVHRPENTAWTGTALLRFRVGAPDRAGQIVVRYRSVDGAREARHVTAERTSAGWIAAIPPADVRPPGFAYWAVEKMPDGSERPLFAAESDPHPVDVFDRPTRASVREVLEARSERRSEVALVGEYVDFGTRNLPAYDEPTYDRYSRAELSYGYLLLGTVEEIRISGGTLRGNAVPLDPALGTTIVDDSIGIDYGKATIGWRALPNLRFYTSSLFGISQGGFDYGGGVDVVIGRPWATSFTIGVDGVTTLGYTARTRLGWATVPSVPMGASIHMTSFPGGEDSGVRLLYDVGYEVARFLVVKGEVGYQARTSITGGASGALHLAFRF